MTPFVPANAAVWFEIPVSDQERAKTFYATVLGTKLTDEEGGPNPMAVFPTADPKISVSGHVYPGKPAEAGTGITIHLSAPAPLEAAMERVEAAGGKVVSTILTIPAGRFVYCLDPDGNSFGLFN